MGNGVTTEVRERIEAALSGEDRVLDLSGLGPAGLPGRDELTGIAELTTLNLSGNRLTELPGWVTELTGLTTLDLSNNALTGIPEGVRRLSALTTLDVNNNRLAEVPD